MRMQFAWTMPSQMSLQVLCACGVLWGAPAAALAVPEQVTPTQVAPEQVISERAAPEHATSTPVVSTPTPAATTSAANHDAGRGGSGLFDRRVLTFLGCLVAMAGAVGMIVGWSGQGPREPRLRLLNKPKKADLPVLVPPGPTPRLIPSESPNVARKRPASAPVPRQTPQGTTSSGIVDYLAPFADPADALDERRVDYLLESGDSTEESHDPRDESDGSLQRTG